MIPEIGKFCPECGFILPMEAFYRHRNCPDGRRTPCKLCVSEKNGWEARIGTCRRPKPGNKFCCTCKEEKPLEDFRRDSRAKSGRSSYCKECAKAKNSEFYKNNREELLRRNGERRRGKPRTDRWAANNQSKILEIKRAYRARKYAAEGRLTAEEWDEILQQNGGKCLACGATEGLPADHVIPLARGGTNDATNIQPLCRRCNSRKHAKTVDYRHETTNQG